MILASLRHLRINRCLLASSFPVCRKHSCISNSPSRKMGSLQGLKEALETFDLQTPAANPHHYPDFHPEYNPLDIYRAHLSSTLADVTGVAAGNIYPCLQWTQSLAKGDMVLPVPALRVKNGKPTDLAQAWAKEVNRPHYYASSCNAHVLMTRQPLMKGMSFLVSELPAC